MEHLTETTLPPDAHGPAPVSTTVDLTGRTLGDFQVLRRLGEGGMGQVYLAEQISLKRKVALKLLKAELASNSTALQRFKLEATAVARATHANIVQVYFIGEEAGLHFMALEYVEGRNLRDFLAKKGPPELLVALSIMRQSAAALQRAAELGIVHRDIKPDNILLTRKGEVKIADFGLSRDLAPEGQPVNLTQSGVTMGTPLYMSPEQVKGLAVDARSDIYSLGVTFYHMLAGHPPFRGATAFDVAIQHVQNEPPPLRSIRPDLPPDLCGLVHKMLAKDPETRYQTGRDVLRDLTHVRESLTGTQSANASQLFSDLGDGQQNTMVEVRPLPSRKRFRWLPLTAAASIVLALVAGAGFGWYYRHPSPPPSPSSFNDDTRTDDALVSPQRREQSLKEAARLYANPTKDQILTGYNLNLELGVFFLDQKRWDEADQHFKSLISNPGNVAEYTYLGKIGHAIVLGLQSHGKESNTLFLEVQQLRGIDQPSGKASAGHPIRNPKLRQWVAEALEYNYKNDSGSFPAKLDPWRKPPGASTKS
jgi:eukaryotic-like serine/threonine-protein kinase